MPLTDSSIDLHYHYTQGGSTVKSNAKTKKTGLLKGKAVESPVKAHYNGDPICTKR
jgi:hypothetical protein